MPAIVMREKNHRRGAKLVRLSVDKSANHELLIVRDEESNTVLLNAEIEELTRRLVIHVPDGAPVVVGSSAAGGIQPMVQANAKEKDKDGLRFWSVDEEKGVFKCWLPNNNAIELPIMDEPGPFTPSEAIPETLGQPEMIFAIALGIKLGKHTLLTGPTGTAKTTTYRWLAQKLNYNLVVCPISRGTEAAHLVGEYLPVDEAGKFEWTDGPVAQAARLSASHPTILLLDEVNRIGNIAEFSRIYSLLDGTRMLELKEKRSVDTATGEATVDRIMAGDLYIGATSNPSDSDGADYIGVQDLDPALNSRFALQPEIKYPAKEVEIKALMDRVDGLQEKEATAMVEAAIRIRSAESVRYPISFRELEAWALALPFYGWKASAEIAVVSKAAKMYQGDLRNLVKLQQAGGARPAGR